MFISHRKFRLEIFLSLSFGTLLAMLEKCCRLRGGLIRWITTAARLPSVAKNVEENNQQGQSTDQVKAITLLWRHLWVKKTWLFSFSLSFQSAINDWDGCQRDRFDVQFICLLVAFALCCWFPTVSRKTDDRTRPWNFFRLDQRREKNPFAVGGTEPLKHHHCKY